jgi:hypothetical protein
MANDPKELEQTKRVMGQLSKMPLKPLGPSQKKQKLTKGKGRVRAGKSRT